MSNYDKIHDEVLPDKNTKKRGTKYERLTAIVAQMLNLGPASHDVKLIGDSEVKHQIDVHVNGKRLIIECKDLDESGDKVDLEIVKSFATVVRDIGPDEAWIVTPIGFTRPARQLAKHLGIKLVVFREFNETDWQGRIRQIVLNLIIKVDVNHRVQFTAGPEGEKELNQALRKFGARVPVSNATTGAILAPGDVEPMDMAHWLLEKRKSFDVLSKDAGEYRESYRLPGATITLGDYGTHAISGIAVDYTVTATDEKIIVDAGEKIAKLILKGFGSGDLIVWDSDLKSYTIDDSGDVLPKGG